MVVDEQGVVDGRQQSRNGIKMVLEVGGRQRGSMLSRCDKCMYALAILVCPPGLLESPRIKTSAAAFPITSAKQKVFLQR